MAIFLVQHGKCLSKEIDPERSLSEKGIAEVESIAAAAVKFRVPVSLIAHSGKKRAIQTAEIFEKALRPSKGIISMEGLKPMDNVQEFAAKLDTSQNAMFVGHLPFMERLASFLVVGKEDIQVFKFQNGGVVCIDNSDGDSWFIRWTIMPDLTLSTSSPPSSIMKLGKEVSSLDSSGLTKKSPD